MCLNRLAGIHMTGQRCSTKISWHCACQFVFMQGEDMVQTGEAGPAHDVVMLNMSTAMANPKPYLTVVYGVMQVWVQGRGKEARAGWPTCGARHLLSRRSHSRQLKAKTRLH